MSSTNGPRQGAAPGEPGAWTGRPSRLRAPHFVESWAGALALYLLVTALVTFVGLGSTGVVMMEGMVAYSAERMLEGGSLLVPELYGEVFTYKPPLLYWLTALSIKAFGPTEWAVRLPGALATLVMGLAVLGLIGRVSKPRIGLFAALAATTGGLWMQKAKIGEFDTALAALIGIAIAAACHNFAAGRSRSSPWIWLLAYLALAAGFLAKGMPALMAFGPGLLGAAVASRQTRQLLGRWHLVAAAVGAAIIGVYLALAWSAAGPVAFSQPLAEARQRGFEWDLEALGRTLTKPLVIFFAFLPWSVAWFWSHPTPTGGEEPDRPLERLHRSAWAFLGLGVLTFMAVPTHVTRYYLPLAVPAAVVSALALDRLVEPSRRASRIFYGLGLAYGGLLMVVALASEFSGGLRVLLGVTGAAALAAVALLRRHRPRYWIACVVLIAALCGWSAETWGLRPYRARFRVLDSVARTLGENLPADATVWALGEAGAVGKSSSLFFYLDRPVRTFYLGRPLPPPGSYVILTAGQLPLLERDSPEEASRLKLIRRVHHPWRVFLLYQVDGASSHPARPEAGISSPQGATGSPPPPRGG